MPDFQVTVASSNLGTFFEALRETSCDIAIVDISDETSTNGYVGGSSMLRRLRLKWPQMRLVAFSPIQDAEAEYVAFMAGANAFVPMAAPAELLSEALIQAPSSRESLLVVREGKLVLERPKTSKKALTLREREILRCLALGLNGTATSRHLCRSAKTVSTQKRNAMRKLGLQNELALALYLERNEW
jgi:DNA-binding NarL/FixJ family response regulator